MPLPGDATSLPTVVIKDKPVKPEVLQIIPYSLAKQYSVVAFADDGQTVQLAVVHPEQLKQGFYAGLSGVEQKIGKKIKVVKTDQASFEYALGLYRALLPQPTPSLNPTPVATAQPAPNLVQWENPPPPPLFELGKLVAFNYLKRIPISFAKQERVVCVDHMKPDRYWFLVEETKNARLHTVLNFMAQANHIQINPIKVSSKDIDDVLGYYQTLLEEEQHSNIKSVLKVEKQEELNEKLKDARERAKLTQKERAELEAEQEKKLREESKAAEKVARLDAAKHAGNTEETEAQMAAEALITDPSDARPDIIRPDLKGEILTQEELRPGLAGLFQKVTQSFTQSDDAQVVDLALNSEEAPPAPASSPVPAAVVPIPDAPATPVVVTVQEKADVSGPTEEERTATAEGMTSPLDPKRPSVPGLGQNSSVVATNPLKDDASDIGKVLSKPVESLEELEDKIKSGSIPKIVAAVISYAINEKASDIHIEAFEDEVRVRFRIDGQLLDVVKLPPDLHSSLVSRIKILAKLRLDENRIPQDGRFDVDFSGKKVDLRVSVMPTVHGEKVVMRILDKSRGIASLEELGIEGFAYKMLTQSIQKPYGIVLATGPTGSGKSTSLYAILNRIATPNVNVVTLEDPIEYEMKGVNQSQIRPKIGYTFAEGLRSILRQDPNIIMVGEIRDGETANMATQSALTGHLVLSTLHTNDSAGAIPRLNNMGIEPFLITASLNVVMGQRLVRKICPNCRKEVNLPEGVKAQFEKDIEEIATINELDGARIKRPLTFYQGIGCDQCEGKGYKGRVGIYEVLVMTDELEEVTLARAGSTKIADLARKQGMITMYQDGLLKVINGTTTLDEVLRETTNR